MLIQWREIDWNWLSIARIMVGMRTANPMPPIERINEAFTYNQDGTLTWKVRPLHHFPDMRAMRIWNTKYSGKKAVGSTKHNGYIYLTFDNKSLSLHRLIWFMHHGSCDPKMEIDNVNGRRSDNRIENLRSATANNNQHNKPLQKNNTSGFKNVRWNKQCRKWQVIMMHMKKTYHFGLFDDPLEAYKAATAARNKLRQEFANHGSFKVEA